MQKYTLTWHDHSNHLRETLKEMMKSTEYSDVTLVTDDKQEIKAHRGILSACSPLFKNILQFDNNNANPIIYLTGIKHSEMESIMQFIYFGETKFCEERMSEFLMVSKNLEIKELSTFNKHEKNNDANDGKYFDDYNTLPGNEYGANLDPQAKSASIISNKLANVKGMTAVVSGDSKLKCKDCLKLFNSQTALRYHTKSIHEGVKYACNHCDHQATDKGHLAQHIQSKHEGVKYACNLCDYQATQQSSLKTHIHSIHDGVKYACDQCVYQATVKGNLTKHIQSQHKGVKYACNQCDYQASKESLKKHIQSKHEGVKYPCNQCDYEGTQQGNLRTHIQSKHDGVKYPCNQCDKQFTQQGALTTHLQSKHEGVK